MLFVEGEALPVRGNRWRFPFLERYIAGPMNAAIESPGRVEDDYSTRQRDGNRHKV